jgi:cellulose synthase/poly-beta-1,6-N-acetylglucosamine synthase-like glycosyltransferase
MLRFSIVVPILGPSKQIDDTLASALRYRPPGSEIIVVHDGSYEDHYDLGNEVRQIKVKGQPGLIKFFNAGVEYATGDIIALARHGVEFNQDWNEIVEEHFEDERVGSVAPALVSSRNHRSLIAAGVKYQYGFRRALVGMKSQIRRNRKSKLRPLGPTSWAAFYRREALIQMGPVDTRLDQHYMDLELALCVSTLGFECVFEPECLMTTESGSKTIAEMTTPHGLSSQRAIRRHVLHLGTIANQGRSLRAFVLEVVTSPLHPWRLKHAFQRKRALRFAVQDEEFSDDISVAARRMRWGDAPKQQRNTNYGHLNKYRKAG